MQDNQENSNTAKKPSLEELWKHHDFQKQLIVSQFNGLMTYKCSKCGLVVKVGQGWYQSPQNVFASKLLECKDESPFAPLDAAKKLYKTKTQQVILIESAKFTIIALDYNDQLISKLSQEHRAELMSGVRRQISNKSYGIKPFNDRIIAVSFRDHFIKDSYRFFKGTAEECFAFMDFYMEQQPEFKPVEFVYKTRFGSTLRYLDVEQFKQAVRK